MHPSWCHRSGTKVGSSYEPEGITGISHALEHMMFRVRSGLAGEFSRVISALGGSENAFTSRDYTAYFETIAVEHLERALEPEADRMRNLILDPAEFAKEIAVVREERRLRTEDKPTGKVYEQFNAVAWRASPYRNPVIGWMNDLEHMTADDLPPGTGAGMHRTTRPWWSPATFSRRRCATWPSATSATCPPAGSQPSPPAEPQQAGETRVRFASRRVSLT